jgi:hypothetical protein
MTVRTTAVVVTAILALVGGVGCGDPLADKLEASGRQPYSDEEAARDEAARVATSSIPHGPLVAEVGERLCTEVVAHSQVTRGEDIPALVARLRAMEVAMRDIAATLEEIEVAEGPDALYVIDAAAQARTAADHYGRAATAAEQGGFDALWPEFEDALHFLALTRIPLQQAGASECAPGG